MPLKYSRVKIFEFEWRRSAEIREAKAAVVA
jgi:hypothetical protein